METLARAIKLAVKIREGSYHLPTNTYKISLEDACDQAAGDAGYDERGTFVVFMLLRNCWNESLEWAEKFKE